MISAKPKVHINDPNKNQRLIYGDTIILEAEVVATPAITKVHWKKDKGDIKPDGKKFCEDNSSEDVVKLIINDSGFDDSGTYSITVTNVLGSAEDHRDVNIKVKGKEIYRLVWCCLCKKLYKV